MWEPVFAAILNAGGAHLGECHVLSALIAAAGKMPLNLRAKYPIKKIAQKDISKYRSKKSRRYKSGAKFVQKRCMTFPGSSPTFMRGPGNSAEFVEAHMSVIN